VTFAMALNMICSIVLAMISVCYHDSLWIVNQLLWKPALGGSEGSEILEAVALMQTLSTYKKPDCHEGTKTRSKH